MVNRNIAPVFRPGKLPKGTSSYELYKDMGLVMLIDIRNGEIVKADSTLSPAFRGFSVKTWLGNIYSIEDIVADIEAVYRNAQRAIISGLKSFIPSI